MIWDDSVTRHLVISSLDPWDLSIVLESEESEEIMSVSCKGRGG